VCPAAPADPEQKEPPAVADSGWYPDPSGAPGRYRYWDGSHWSAETTDNPSTPPPSAGLGSADNQYQDQRDQQYGGYPTGGQPSNKRRRAPLLIGGLALLVVLTVVIVMVVRMMSDRHDAVLDPDPPQSTVSGWNDSSPLPTATPSPTASSSPTESAEPQGLQACPDGEPSDRQPHPSDDRIYGGDLSFSPPSGYERDTGYSTGFTWAYDTDGVSVTTEPGWASLMAVGYVKKADGFTTPKKTASLMMECIASSGYYLHFTGRKDIFSQQVTVDGHQGWAIRADIKVDDPSISVSGDVAEIMVLDTGTTGQLSFFGAFIPIGDQTREQKMDETIKTLQVG